ncbi:hypothetical protein BDV27DRAFT_160168 [Aspergillus caelatus]|uniref:Uncharacterized protein n=1 Tax=Aspergillus caelatus TaxID=61420 RepID=A0A5N6ZXC4_9EURO|nr:uncharacterized protein BDV27DRAFT_160168 [Aspergillus caelatus]KAE8362008.1 hypothetical protein BDV27DRAFT_160168 [Aspergillus caelatus]
MDRLQSIGKTKYWAEISILPVNENEPEHNRYDPITDAKNLRKSSRFGAKAREMVKHGRLQVKIEKCDNVFVKNVLTAPIEYSGQEPTKDDATKAMIHKLDTMWKEGSTLEELAALHTRRSIAALEAFGIESRSDRGRSSREDTPALPPTPWIPPLDENDLPEEPYNPW